MISCCSNKWLRDSGLNSGLHFPSDRKNEICAFRVGFCQQMLLKIVIIPNPCQKGKEFHLVSRKCNKPPSQGTGRVAISPSSVIFEILLTP